MFNENFYNLKTAVMTHQHALRQILAEHGINAEGLSIYEMVPLLRQMNVDLSFISAEANDILLGKVSVDKNGNRITGLLKPGIDVSATTATAADVKIGKNFYTAAGKLTNGQNTDVNVTATTAAASDVLQGKKFYNASGVLTQGSLVIPEDTGVDVSATTATASDVKQGKKFYTADGVLTSGINTDVNVSATTANAADVAEGKQFYDAQGVLTNGTLVPQTVIAMDFFKCAAVAQEPLPEPVFAEKFNGTLTNDFTQLGEAPVFETIDDRQCMKCDYDHRLTRSAEGLPSGNSPRTMSAWIYCKPETVNGNFAFFAGYGGDEYNCYYISTYYDQFCNYSENLRTNYPEYDAWGQVQANRWHFVAMSFDGSTMRCYVDGALAGQVNITYETDTSNYALSIGHLTFSSNPYDTSGYISDLQIYDVALSAEQVEELYNKNNNGSSSTDLIVSGFSDDHFNGRYSMQDTSATGIYRVWVKDDIRIQTDMDTDENVAMWRFLTDEWDNVENPSVAYSHMPYENPWDAEEWMVYTDFHGISGTPVVALADSGSGDEPPSLPANTWNGYKAVLVTDDDGKKYYEFEETLTEGLTFGNGFTPVVDKVYDTEAMIEANLFQKLIPLISSPENMTDFENEEWLISSTPAYSDRVAWCCFGGNGAGTCWLKAGAPNWIQWENKARQVLVKQVIVSCHNGYDFRQGFLQGSNDGNTWTDIVTGDFYAASDNDRYKITLDIPDNKTAYYYHRIGSNYNSGSYLIVYSITAKSRIE